VLIWIDNFPAIPLTLLLYQPITALISNRKKLSIKNKTIMEKYLWIAGSLPFIILGSIHLLYTFFTNKLDSRSKTLNSEMTRSFLVLTTATNMWKAWKGFNASHSSGTIYFGLVNMVLALQYPMLMQNSLLQSATVIAAGFYVWLAKNFWFRIPFIGMLISFACFLYAVVLNLGN